MIECLSSKIHMAVVTDANINYEGSITISNDFIDRVGIREYQRVSIVDVNNGQRFETYVISTDEKKRICLNGAAARLVSVGDRIIIMAYELISSNEKITPPKIIILDENNEVKND